MIVRNETQSGQAAGAGVALVVLYNHCYPQNIDVIERIYAGRFDRLYHLIPFYQGDRPNVIPVYESSSYFQGYVAQSRRHYLDPAVQHYIFVADDLILNPCINQDNYAEHFKLGPGSCYVTTLQTPDQRGYWHHNLSALGFTEKPGGLEISGMLPTVEEALARLARFGLHPGPLQADQIWRDGKPPKGWGRKPDAYDLPYPFVRSYSDLFVVSGEVIERFSHLSGLFAATHLFCELAVPTAMVLASDEIVLQHRLDLKGQAMWSGDDFQVLERYDTNLDLLLADFPEGRLFLHPVKLSKWGARHGE